MAGICTAIKLKTDLGITNFEILERNSEIGGTWWVNTYPGCECDVPSYFFSYSFEQKFDWTQEYASQAEILQYMKKIVRKHDLYKHIRFNANVVRNKYNAQTCTWMTFLDDDHNTQIESNILIQCNGGLNQPKIPEIDGQQLFKGMSMHSGAWDNEYSFKNKKVAVVGSGTSAIQIVPALIFGTISSLKDFKSDSSKFQSHLKCEQMYVFQRSPTYIFPKPNKKVSQLRHWLYYYCPALMYSHRLLLYIV
jgi:cation diffusion facilitator CzcD-associated flavoprotein CzcO